MDGDRNARKLVVTTNDRAFYILWDDFVKLNKGRWLVKADICKASNCQSYPEDETVGWNRKWVTNDLMKSFALFLEKGERERTMVVLPNPKSLPKLYLIRRKLWKTIVGIRSRLVQRKNEK